MFYLCNIFGGKNKLKFLIDSGNFYFKWKTKNDVKNNKVKLQNGLFTRK